MIAAGDWKIGRILGRGATATVSLAAASPSGELFAVKSSPIARSALLRKEQSILSTLDSPHIISCLGSDESGDSFRLFLELATGGTLSDLAGRIEEPEVRSVTRQILLALRYIHSVGIAHCDVKGQNILLCSDGRVKVCDFGCARRVGADETPRHVMGTPAFMAPEVARGEEQGIAGDIWALGCTVVEMAAGGSPWPEVDSAVAALHRIGFSSDVPVIPERLSKEGKDFVSRCLMRDPKQRWTAEELLLHPFVAAENQPMLGLTEKQGRWVSPKSTLDFGLWGMETEDEKEDEECSIASQRILDLASPLAPADWTWSGTWISVISIASDEAVDSEASSSFGNSMELVASTSVCDKEEAEHETENMITSSDTVKEKELRTSSVISSLVDSSQKFFVSYLDFNVVKVSWETCDSCK